MAPSILDFGGSDQVVLAVDLDGREAGPAIVPNGQSAVGRALHIELLGHDRPGIARQLTRILTGLGAEVETFATRLSKEPHSGASLFQMEACLRLPPRLRASEVQAALEDLSAEIVVDISPGPAACWLAKRAI